MAVTSATVGTFAGNGDSSGAASPGAFYSGKSNCILSKIAAQSSSGSTLGTDVLTSVNYEAA